MGFWTRVLGLPNAEDDRRRNKDSQEVLALICEQAGVVPPDEVDSWQAHIKADVSFSRTEIKRIDRAIAAMTEKIARKKAEPEDNSGIIGGLLSLATGLMPTDKVLLEELHSQRDFVEEYGGRGGSFTPPPPKRTESVESALLQLELAYADAIKEAKSEARLNELKQWKESERRRILGL